MYWVLFIGISLLSYAVQALLQARYRKFSQIAISSGLTGAQVAEKMLHDNGIYDVQITCIQGTLTDHYDPTKKMVNLSEGVYRSNSVMAAAVAAHECGHVVQHATGYAFLRLRSALVPMVSFSSKIVMWVLLAGMALIKVFPQLMLAGIILFALTTLFSFVTLPVEFDASRRALVWLERSGITDHSTDQYAHKALRSAAYTYVVAALSSLATLFYYIMIFSGGRRD